MIKNLLTVFFILTYIFSSSQVTDYFDELKSEFDIKDQEKLELIAENIALANDLLPQAENFIQSGDTAKSLNIYKKTSDIFKTNYRILFLLFESKLDEFLPDIRTEKSQYIEKSFNDAKNSLRISIARRHLADKEKDKLLSYEFYKSAHVREQEAIDYQSHMYAVIKDKITVDLTVEEIDYTLKVFDNAITDNFEERTFTVYDPSVQQNLTYYAVNKQNNYNNSNKNSIVNNQTTNKNNSNNTNSNSKNFYRVKLENGQYAYKNSNSNTEEVLSDGDRRVYRIQIGTSILPASGPQIEKLNSTDLEVNIYKSKVYYKYTIGNFKTFRDAKNFKNAFGLRNTYIVEYRNLKEYRFYLKDYI